MTEERWDGAERRNMNHCDSHLEMVKSVAIIETTIVSLDKRINGSLTSIEKHMEQGGQWRIAIIGVSVTLLIQLGGFIIFASKQGKQIEVNTKRLDTAEETMKGWYSAESTISLNQARLDRVQTSFEKLCERVAVLERVSYGFQNFMTSKKK